MRSMSKLRILPALARVFAGAVPLLFSALLHAQTPSTGSIEGRVFDPRRGEYLEKARVTLDGTGQEVLTDATGHYRLMNVPAGPVRIVVFFTGLGRQTELVSVESTIE